MSEPTTRPTQASPLDAAVDHLRNGELDEAARLCEGLLAADPGNGGALHLLGTVRTQQRDLHGAMDLFQRALDADATKPAHWFSHGTLLKELGRHEEALASLDQAVTRDPAHALAHCVRGDALSALGRPSDALAAYDRALQLNSRLPDAHNNRGNELRALGRHAEALAAYDRVLAMVPQHAVAIVNRGNALFELGRYEEALAAYRKAMPLLPNLAQLHVKAGDALQALDRFAEALASHERALALAPDLVQAVNGRAVALSWLRRLEEAETEARRAVALQPDYAPGHNTLGNITREQGQVEDATAHFRSALSLDSTLAEARYNLAHTLLLQGTMGEEAWRLHEVRRQLRRAWIVPPAVDAPEWQGEPIAGKRILVWAEQGLGDTIQHFALMSRLQERGARVVFLSWPHLARLLRSSATDIEIVTVPPTTVDFHVPLMSLPYRLGLTLETIPATVPYLAAEPDRVAAWRTTLGDGFKVGIAWQGTPDGRIDIGRSFPLAALAPLAAVPGVRLISLQKGAGSEQLDRLPPGLGIERLADLDQGPDAFLDTAAVMQGLDLVITSDTAIAHLAGALGRPVWVGLQHVPDWRWLMQRADTPWYPTMRLFRQQTRGDWNGVFNSMAAALADAVRRKRPDPIVPVSWGELADKITILEIKSARLASPVQRANVARELAALAPVLDSLDAGPVGLGRLRAELKAINERLWEIEDKIRAKEAAACFDGEFVALARAVYATNDERGRIKRRINDLVGSNLVEEKQYHAYDPAAAKAIR